MNKEYNELMVKNLLEENHKLKQMLNEYKINENVIKEKINTIRFIFTIFENCKSEYVNSSIVLFGKFLENLIYKKSLDNYELCFYFSIKDNINILNLNLPPPFLDSNKIINKFFNIINNTDYFEHTLTSYNQQNMITKWTYNINKNNIKFKISFLNGNIKNDFFNLENIEFDSCYGLKIKDLSVKDLKKNITDRNIALLDIFMNNYLNNITPIKKTIEQNEMYDFITLHNMYVKKGYNIENGLKLITLGDSCGICYEKNVKGILLNCRHSFCVNCIKKHLKINENQEKKCPMCRGDLKLVFG